MNRRNFIKTLGILVGGTLVLPNMIFADDKYKKVYNWIKNFPEGHNFIQYSPSEAFVSFTKEEDISKFNYKYKWNIHNVSTDFFIVNKKMLPKGNLLISKREYKDLATIHSRQFKEYNLTDYGSNGIIDKSSRRFEITQSDEDGDNAPFFFINPEYPKWFIKENYHKIPKDIAQKIYEEEINYWLKEIK